MRTIVFSLLLFFTFTQASAICNSGGIWLLSNDNTLTKNGILILQFYGDSKLIVPELNKKHAIYLQSGSGKVVLKPVEILQGEFSVTQVLLKPVEALENSETYTLVIDSLRYERLRRYNTATKKWEPCTFTITKETIPEKLLLKDCVTESKKTINYYGCGPARSVYFKIEATAENNMYVRASVKCKQTGKETDFVLIVKDGEAMVGHGMCNGPFYLKEGHSYEVIFTLMDLSGNTGESSQPVYFTSPDSSSETGAWN